MRGLLQLHVVGGARRRRVRGFEEARDIFDPPRGRLREHVYAAGGSRDPAALYESFRGRLPTPDALLRRRGCSMNGRPFMKFVCW